VPRRFRGHHDGLRVVGQLPAGVARCRPRRPLHARLAAHSNSRKFDDAARAAVVHSDNVRRRRLDVQVKMLVRIDQLSAAVTSEHVNFEYRTIGIPEVQPGFLGLVSCHGFAKSLAPLLDSAFARIRRSPARQVYFVHHPVTGACAWVKAILNSAFRWCSSLPKLSGHHRREGTLWRVLALSCSRLEKYRARIRAITP
jgi:hypothetical protein